MTPQTPVSGRPRVALYGHDTQGLGHLRRNLHLAAGLAADLPDGLGADVLVLTGAAEVGLFERPHGVDAVVVPGVRKDAGGGYRPRRLRGHELGDVVDLRSCTIAGALYGFSPDVLVVDKAPWGFSGELSEVLPQLKSAGTRLVLGLRDVLDDPVTASREWRHDRGDDAVRALYDEVWVYGDESIHDVPAAAGMAADVGARVHHIGYVSGRGAGLQSQPCVVDIHPAAVEGRRPPLPPGVDEYVLVMLGGGQDGVALARQAVRMTMPLGVAMVLLAGPQMSSGHVAELRAMSTCDHIVIPFSSHASEWLAGAAAAITMGGANTVAEILSTSTPALIVPRTRPRRERAIRAEALAARGLVDVLAEPWLNSRVLSDWARRAVGRSVDRSAIDLSGVRRARDRVEILLGRHEGSGLSPLHRTHGGRGRHAGRSAPAVPQHAAPLSGSALAAHTVPPGRAWRRGLARPLAAFAALVRHRHAHHFEEGRHAALPA